MVTNICLIEAEGISSWQKRTTQTRVIMLFLSETLLTSIKERQTISIHNWHNTNRHCRVLFKLGFGLVTQSSWGVRLRDKPNECLRRRLSNESLWDKSQRMKSLSLSLWVFRGGLGALGWKSRYISGNIATYPLQDLSLNETEESFTRNTW